MDSRDPNPRLRLHPGLHPDLHPGSGRLRRPIPPLDRPVEVAPVAATVGPSHRTSNNTPPPPGQPTAAQTLDPTDPRWVLALRTGRALRGDVLRPKDRDGLVRLGRLLGLRPFEVSLVIAIVQDRARRGLGTDAAADLLRFVPLRSAEPREGRARRFGRVALWTSAVLLTELLLILAIF